MNIHQDPGYVEVTLSKRNLDTLIGLYSLYERGEALPAIARQTEDGPFVRVIVQPDETHYGDREPGNGSMIRAALQEVQS